MAYQLHERTGFVKPPDPVVGDLIEAYANLTAIEHAIEHALPIYDLALAYQPARAAAIEERRDGLAELAGARVSARETRDTAMRWGAIVAIPLCALRPGLVRRAPAPSSARHHRERLTSTRRSSRGDGTARAPGVTMFAAVLLLLFSILNAIVGFSSDNVAIAAFAKTLAALGLGLAFMAGLSARYLRSGRSRGSLD